MLRIRLVLETLTFVAVIAKLRKIKATCSFLLLPFHSLYIFCVQCKTEKRLRRYVMCIVVAIIYGDWMLRQTKARI